MINELFDLTGKTALVTGASSGLGRQMAKTLANAGADIIAVARNKQRLEELSHYIENIGRTIKTYHVDLSSSDEIGSFLNDIKHKNTVTDILVNNAGIGELTPVDDDNLELWDKHIRVNLKAVWQLSQGIAQQMFENNIPGSIINISSVNGANVPHIDVSAYAATKAAVNQLTKTLSGALSQNNIRVNTILPGFFYTEMTSERIDSHTGTDNDVSNQIPLGFVATPEDMDGLILYLSSNKASRYVTGAEFVIDGGLSVNCRGI